jgi:ribonuclease-3
LQEWALGRALPVPVYREVKRSGPDHAPLFVIAAEVQGFSPCEAEGPSKRLAEHAAAVAFMTREGVERP